jgi:hypothetical protein
LKGRRIERIERKDERRRRWKIEAGIASESGLKERSRFCSSLCMLPLFARLCDFRKRKEQREHCNEKQTTMRRETKQGFGLRGEKSEHTSFFLFSYSATTRNENSSGLTASQSLGKEEKMRLLMMEAQRH